MSDWTATFEDDRAAKRDTWSRLSPEELLRWLEDGLDSLRDLGLLEPARAARAQDASTSWRSTDSPSSAADATSPDSS